MPYDHFSTKLSRKILFHSSKHNYTDIPNNISIAGHNLTLINLRNGCNEYKIDDIKTCFYTGFISTNNDPIFDPYFGTWKQYLNQGLFYKEKIYLNISGNEIDSHIYSYYGKLINKTTYQVKIYMSNQTLLTLRVDSKNGKVELEGD